MTMVNIKKDHLEMVQLSLEELGMIAGGKMFQTNGRLYASLAESHVVFCRINRRNKEIIICKHYNGRRSILGNLKMIAVFLLKLRRGILAYKAVVRVHMGDRLIHRDNWIEEYLKVWTCLCGCVTGNGRGEMSACR